MSVRAGREFLAIPGPTNVPDEVLRAMHRPAVDIYAGPLLALTDGLKNLLKDESIYGFIFEGKRYDAGEKLGFLKATVEYALKEPTMGEQFRKYLKSLQL